MLHIFSFNFIGSFSSVINLCKRVFFGTQAPAPLFAVAVLCNQRYFVIYCRDCLAKLFMFILYCCYCIMSVACYYFFVYPAALRVDYSGQFSMLNCIIRSWRAILKLSVHGRAVRLPRKICYNQQQTIYSTLVWHLCNVYPPSFPPPPQNLSIRLKKNLIFPFSSYLYVCIVCGSQIHQFQIVSAMERMSIIYSIPCIIS